MKILILDDDEGRSNTLRDHIVRENVCDIRSILLSADTSQARQEVTKQYFDVVVMDVVLPKRGSERASAENGLEFLRTLSRGGKYIKPGRIIGITGYLDDISRFREKFEESCNTVIEARSGDASWRDRIVAALRYTSEAKFAKSVVESKMHAITIHGIQTFGGWQNRLQSLTDELVPGVPFHSYTYGFFSILAFFIPYVRNREVKILAKKLKALFEKNSEDSKFVIFSHSFGTYLMTKALLLLVDEGAPIPVRTLVLSGSVLPERFSMHRLRERGILVVNDCGDHDYVLYLSKAVVPGTGMAGKSGLYGFQDTTGLNRFFVGGHSHYFHGDDFMRKYWVPLLGGVTSPEAVDFRSISFIRHSVLDKLVVSCGFIKHYLYGALLVVATYWLLAKAFN
jgi:CheY-like chemotaxis protein